MTYKNILIVKLSAIGDVIHALPVAHALKQTYPNARITWVVEKPAYDLLTNNPDIDEIIIFDKPKFKSLTGLLSNGYTFSKLLKSHHFDLAIDLQGLFKSAAISYLSGAPKRLVYCNARELSDKISQRICGNHEDDHVVDRYLDVAQHLGCNIDQVQFLINITEVEAQKAETIANHAGLRLENPYVVLAPGTNWPSKCWPTTHFVELADILYDNNIIPVIIGAPNDQRLAQEILSNTKIPPIDLTGKTSLKQLAYIIKKSQAFVGGDTGPMHLAVAVGTSVVTMFGPTDPKRNGPYGRNHRVLLVSDSCQGCWQRKCPKNNDCLARISVDTVFAVVQQEVSERQI
ncbi:MULTISPECIES: lipopolysaccharide heptosyltransferase II [Pelosinus]|uniref:lipopolysaccharide heptosyltransferase II n=1 Tax=Pelosinus fermentans B4 TaxID=1149862 RepID=I9L6Z2_9FIRM|nr:MULTISPECIES: lipopolysaccharide heptosyltransferase II [Pelosinus]EIW16011.1 lipopolysaccharide heptosyltransferase II [Pelosinus fermentans B4]EIW27283.1 lipopolysaccharide heptosyltransferase II [Pelosinus fermentans A11]